MRGDAYPYSPGGSSFTGYWFIKELVSAGHEVIATFQRQPNEYPDETASEARRRPRGAAVDRSSGLSFSAMNLLLRSSKKLGASFYVTMAPM